MDDSAAAAPRRLADLAAEVGGEVVGDGGRKIGAVRTLEAAGPHDLAPYVDPAYRAAAEASTAGALLVPRDHARLTEGLGERDLLRAPDPRLALVVVLELLHPPVPPAPGIHPTAVIGEGCEVDPSAHVGAYSVIGAGTRVGAGAAIGPLAAVGRECAVGEGCRLHPHSTLYDHTVLERGAVVHAGAVVGSDGYGYVARGGVHRKVPQVGRAVIGEDVEIGANSAIDRGALGDTHIGGGSKIDNLVQVAHNVRTGRGVLLCGQAGIAGSTTLGDHVVLGGQAGVTDHRRLGHRVQVAGKSAVFDDVPDDTGVGGIPAVELGSWRRQTVLVRRLEAMSRRLRRLEKELESHRRSTSREGHGGDDDEEEGTT